MRALISYFKKVENSTQKLTDNLVILILALALLWQLKLLTFLFLVVSFWLLLTSLKKLISPNRPSGDFSAQLIAYLYLLVFITVNLGLVKFIGLLLLLAIAYELPKQIIGLITLIMPRPKITPKDILIERSDVIGDLVCSTPVIKIVKHHFPKAELSFLAHESTADLVKHNPAIKEVITDQPFKNRKFDLVIALWEKPVFALSAFLAKIPIRCGDLTTQSLGWLFNFGIARRNRDMTCHQVERNLELLAGLGIKDFGQPDLDVVLGQAEIAFAQKTLTELGISKDDFLLAISPGARSNRSPLSTAYAGFIKLAQDKYKVKTILLGSSKESTLASEIIRLVGNDIFDLTGKTLPAEGAALIAKARVHVSPDSGPAHLAAALKIPTLTFFLAKPEKPLRWGAWLSPHRIIRKPFSCPLCCRPNSCQLDYCTKPVTSEEIFAEFEALVKGNGIIEPLNKKHYWAQKSFNILVFGNQDGQVAKLMIEAGYNVATASKLNFKLLDLIVEKEVNIIYNLNTGASWGLKLLAHLAGSYQAFPPLVVKPLKQAKNASELTDYFINECKKTD